MKRILIIIIVLTYQFSFAQFDSTAFRIIPRDELKADTSLAAFLEKLKSAALSKDTFSLYPLLDKDILSWSNFGVNGVSWTGNTMGLNTFRMVWELDKPDKTDLWDVLLKLINAGGTLDTINGRKIFTLPYCNAHKYIDIIEREKYQHISTDCGLTQWSESSLVCTSNNVNVYEKSDTTSTVTGSLSYHIVNTDFPPTHEDSDRHFYFRPNWDWLYISTIDNKIKGWVQGKHFFDLCRYSHMGIWKVDNEWKLVSLSLFD